MVLTLIVNAKVRALVIVIHNRTETGEGGRFGLHLTNFSWVPPFALGEAILLNDVLVVEVVHADLPRYLSGW